MSTQQDREIPTAVRARPEDVTFDLDRALSSVVGIRAEIPEDAFTAGVLGTERGGSGIVINERGLILTIGYLITEAETIWLTTVNGGVVPGHALGYDFATGFGLVQPLGPIGVPAIDLGSTADLRVGDNLVVAGPGGRPGALRTRLLAKREFAGYWEYLLDEALFTSPAHPFWGGAACIGPKGTLVGIGSLLIQEENEGEGAGPATNMIVPIDLLPPILQALSRTGRSSAPPRPWLGWYLAETRGRVVVSGLARGGPAHKAGVEPGDAVAEVDGMPVGDLADLYRQVWAQGEAGAEVPLKIMRNGRAMPMVLHSAERGDFLRRPRLH